MLNDIDSRRVKNDDKPGYFNDGLSRGKIHLPFSDNAATGFGARISHTSLPFYIPD